MELHDVSTDIIDIRDALKRVGGNMDLLKRLLKMFADGNHLEGLLSEITGGNLDEAAKLAHAIKGMSANLSLKNLQSASSGLEQSLKSGGDYAQFLKRLEETYEVTLAGVAAILNESP